MRIAMEPLPVAEARTSQSPVSKIKRRQRAGRSLFGPVGTAAIAVCAVHIAVAAFSTCPAGHECAAGHIIKVSVFDLVAPSLILGLFGPLLLAFSRLALHVSFLPPKESRCAEQRVL